MATPTQTKHHKPGDAIMGDHHDWVLDAPIGEGGSGEVWLAHRRDDASIRGAAKIILGDPAEGLARVQREARLTKRIAKDGGSRFLLALLDGGYDAQDRPVLIHEYAAGGNLAGAWNKRALRGWSEAEAAWIGQMVLAGLSALRSAPHRDIKPENLYLVDAADPTKRKGLVVGDTSAARVVVGDLGLVGIEPGRPDARLTKEGKIAGTLGYIASEGYNEGALAVDQSGDVYALGVSLLAMLVADEPNTLPWSHECQATSESEYMAFESEVAADGPMARCSAGQLSKLSTRMAEVLAAMTSPFRDRRPSVADAAMALATISGAVIVGR